MSIYDIAFFDICNNSITTCIIILNEVNLQLNIINNFNHKILLELALYLNQELFNEHKISYQIYKYTESGILGELNIK